MQSISILDLDLTVDRSNRLLLAVHRRLTGNAVFWDFHHNSFGCCSARKLFIKVKQNIDALLKREQFVISRVPYVQVFTLKR